MSRSHLKIAENTDEVVNSSVNQDSENETVDVDDESSLNEEDDSDLSVPTNRMMSWSAVRFISKPSPRIFQIAVSVVFIGLIVSVLATNFVKIEMVVEGPGEITSSLGVYEVASNLGGQIHLLKKSEGDHVEVGEVIAETSPLGTDNGEIIAVLEKLKNIQKIIESKNIQSVSKVEMPVFRMNRIGDQNIIQSLLGFEQALAIFRIGIPSAKSLSSFRQSLFGTLATIESYISARQIIAPVTGSLVSLISDRGSIIQQNRAIASILPEGSSLIAEIRIPSKDIVQVRVNQKVYYKVEAYPYQQFGLFEGNVISFDKVKNGNGTGDDFFVRADIRAPANLDPELQKKLKFIIGMRLNASIRTDRKPLSELLSQVVFGQ